MVPPCSRSFRPRLSPSPNFQTHPNLKSWILPCFLPKLSTIQVNKDYSTNMPVGLGTNHWKIAQQNMYFPSRVTCAPDEHCMDATVSQGHLVSAKLIKNRRPEITGIRLIYIKQTLNFPKNCMSTFPQKCLQGYGILSLRPCVHLISPTFTVGSTIGTPHFTLARVFQMMSLSNV